MVLWRRQFCDRVMRLERPLIRLCVLFLSQSFWPAPARAGQVVHRWPGTRLTTLPLTHLCEIELSPNVRTRLPGARPGGVL